MNEDEQVVVYTEDGKPITTISKKDYGRFTGSKKELEKMIPWVECVTCFVIDKNDSQVAVELRGINEIDPGEMDLCSGHVRAGEAPKATIARELKEEMALTGFTSEQLENMVVDCGRVKMDFTKGKNSKGKNLRCFATVYALVLDGKSSVKPNESAVIKIGWKGLEKVKDMIRKSGFRFPYTPENAEKYEEIFSRVSEVLKEKSKSRDNQFSLEL